MPSHNDREIKKNLDEAYLKEYVRKFMIGYLSRLSGTLAQQIKGYICMLSVYIQG